MPCGWLAETDPVEVAAAVEEFFPDTSKEVLAASIARYKEQEQWPDSPVLAQPEFESLHDILLAAGMCRERQPYEKIVITGIAERAAAAV